jgi:hypothetical protein
MAEHDDTQRARERQRVRERMRDLIALKFEGWGEAWVDDESGDRLAHVATDAAMAVVDAVLAARDAAVELLNGTRVALGHAEDKASDRLRDLVATRRDAAQAIAAEAKAVRDLEAELAAARQQLAEVRAAVDGWPATTEPLAQYREAVLRLFDVPARPAGHDESGQ